MSTKSTPTQYGSVAVTIHWASALAVILTWTAGFAVDDLVQAPALLLAHITLGSVVLLLTLLRIVWWLVADKHPAAPADQPRWQVLVAQIVHFSLYVLLLLMVSSGIVTVVLSGAIPTLLGGGPIPDFSSLAPRIAHGLMSRLLLGLLVVHVGAALYHQLVRRDHLLARMGVGRA